MTAISTIKGIAPGKIVYHVYGSHISKHGLRGDIDCHIDKLIVTSFPHYWHYSTQSSTESLFFDVLRVCRNGETWRSCNSVNDCGIDCTHGKYNLNRIFATRIEAREFISQCLAGAFFDNEDQEIYNRHRSNLNDYFDL